MRQLMGLGRGWNGELLVPARSMDDVLATTEKLLAPGKLDLLETARLETEDRAVRAKLSGKRYDPGNPKDAGWCYLYSASDPNAPRYPELLRALATLRGMGSDDEPIVFDGEPQEKWLDWISRAYHGRTTRNLGVPGFVLILGGPQAVPFKLQALLQTVACVGRLDTSNLDALKAYVDKVVRLEQRAKAVVEKEAIFFATDEGPSDPTHFSRTMMAEPLAAFVRDTLHYNVVSFTGEAATKASLLQAGTERRPALVYTASHGMGATDQPLETQQRYNGALYCQVSADSNPTDRLFEASDVPMDRPFFEGAIVFQFACYGYGTPAQSDFRHWLENPPTSNAPNDFLSALPLALLSHPNGPIAYIGHVDVALLSGFTEGHDPVVEQGWSPRMAPFKSATELLLSDIAPAGFALARLSQRYAVTNGVLATIYDSAARASGRPAPPMTADLVEMWLQRADAQNFMVMGDPAAVLSIRDPDSSD